MLRFALPVFAAMLIACGDNRLVEIDAPIAVADAAEPIDAPVASPDAPGITFACSLADLAPLGQCAQMQCAMTPTLECFALRCGIALLGLPPACRQCVGTAILTMDLQGTIAACISGLPTPPPTPPGP